ncbi:DUF2314 domain-containing protein [Hymenobacter chitinivorans]|uniref:Uncharacterized protein DUF2314 n=1 Tax=Hymenobacter chitinivorans DSM 11115 TaxID=1121954 RepID=A0A2M9B581_9BACT|nr:DUF2314 domain-containing protein [Hymenobacter chitinivorans]PJJ53084.1 uncharacterized protein DUF2314 [Hymenobacter chitinivorans DSM 11115]
MSSFRAAFLSLLLLPGLGFSAWAQQAVPDKPVSIATGTEAGSVGPAQSMALFDQLIAKPMKEALRTLPQAKKRFEAGLKPGETFYLTTRVVDADGKFEQVFVQVRQWEDTYVQGTIANALQIVQGYSTGQTLEFTTSAVYDWTIVRADGSEEGNYVGKFLDIQNRLDRLGE